MIVHHMRRRETRWQLGLAINIVGAVACFVVLCIVVISKFTEGAWIPTVVIPAIVVGFRMINRHYRTVELTMGFVDPNAIPTVHHTVVIPIGGINPAVLQAIGYARAMRPDHVVAVKVVPDEAARVEALEAWEGLGCGIPLDIVESPYRDLAGPIIDHIDQIDSLYGGDLITVLIPEYVVHHWWHHALHNQSALVLKAGLLHRPNTAVTSLPIQVPD
jgi:hypothetical protein